MLCSHSFSRLNNNQGFNQYKKAGNCASLSKNFIFNNAKLFECVPPIVEFEKRTAPKNLIEFF
jgi:hypothetical protein